MIDIKLTAQWESSTELFTPNSENGVHLEAESRKEDAGTKKQ